MPNFLRNLKITLSAAAIAGTMGLTLQPVQAQQRAPQTPPPSNTLLNNQTWECTAGYNARQDTRRMDVRIAAIEKIYADTGRAAIQKFFLDNHFSAVLDYFLEAREGMEEMLKELNENIKDFPEKFAVFEKQNQLTREQRAEITDMYDSWLQQKSAIEQNLAVPFPATREEAGPMMDALVPVNLFKSLAEEYGVSLSFRDFTSPDGSVGLIAMLQPPTEERPAMLVLNPRCADNTLADASMSYLMHILGMSFGIIEPQMPDPLLKPLQQAPAPRR